MKALITGAAGFVGRHLVPKLCDYEGKVLVDVQAYPKIDHLSLLTKALSDSAEEYGQFDLVVHLAANIVNVDARMRGGMEMFSDIELDLAMCRWLEKNPPKQCAVLLSSCAVDYPQDPYCIVKRNLEIFARTLHKKGVPVIVLRPFSGYGDDQSDEYPFRAILERVLRKEDPLTVWGGKQIRDFIHVDDLTDAIMFAIKELPRRPEAVEVGTRRSTSLFELARKMAAAAGYDPLIVSNESKAVSSTRRVSGENGVAIMQTWGWTHKVTLEAAISRAIEKRQACQV